MSIEQRLKDLEQRVASMEKVASAPRCWSDQNKVTRIIGQIATYFGVNPDDIYGYSRKFEIVNARHVAMHVIKVTQKIPFAQLGRILKRDHGAIIYAHRSIIDRMSVEPELRKEVNKLIAFVRGDNVQHE